MKLHDRILGRSGFSLLLCPLFDEDMLSITMILELMFSEFALACRQFSNILTSTQFLSGKGNWGYGVRVYCVADGIDLCHVFVFVL